MMTQTMKPLSSLKECQVKCAMTVQHWYECPVTRRRLSWIPIGVAVLLWGALSFGMLAEQKRHVQRTAIRELLTKAYETGETAVVVVGQDNHVRVANTAAATLFGYDLMGHDVTELWQGAARQTMEHALTLTLQGQNTGAPLRLEGPTQLAAGVLPMQVTMRSAEQDGQHVAVLTIFPTVSPTITLSPERHFRAMGETPARESAPEDESPAPAPE